MDIVENEKPIFVVPDDGVLGLPRKEHTRILRKLDWHIMPLVSLLYLLSFLDRVNIGNARIAGMSTDLNLYGLRYNIAVAIFFIPYCLGQVPSNILLKLMRPSRWLPTMMVIWGLITTLMCLVNTYGELLVARFFLGLAEAGLFPGVAHYLSLWYPRAERAQRLATFISAAIIGGAFGGVLAYGIVKMEGIGGLHGWQWIFCLEGLATVIVALASPFIMFDTPETASFLTEAERRYVVALMKQDAEGLATHYSFEFVMQAFKDYKTYLQLILYIGLVIAGYGSAYFTPTIIYDLGFTAATAELLSVPPFIVGSVVTILASVCSDRLKLRGPFVGPFAIITIVGYALLYTQTKPGISYFGVLLVAMGVFPCIPIELAWISSNVGGEIRRGAAIAIINGFGNFGGICAAFIFFDPPRFHVGLTITMTLLGLTTLMSAVVMWEYARLNKQRERICRERGITEDQKEEFSDLGDDSPLFRFTL